MILSLKKKNTAKVSPAQSLHEMYMLLLMLHDWLKMFYAKANTVETSLTTNSIQV